MSSSGNEFFDKANHLTPLRPGPQPVSGVVPNSGACADAVAQMSNMEKLRRTFEYAVSLDTLSIEAKRALMEMVAPENLKISAMILAGWALAHFFGVGEVVDAILVGITLANLGPQGIQGLADLVEFGYDVINAKCDFDLRRASEKLARAFVILGVEVVQALLKGKAKIKPNHAKAAPGSPKIPQSSALPRTQQPPTAESPKLAKPAGASPAASQTGWGRGQVPCFPAGTLVATPGGSVRIETLAAGDAVYAYDFVENELVRCIVDGVHSGHTTCWVHVDWGSGGVLATRQHPIWVESRQSWVEASLLEPNAELRLMSNEAVWVARIEEHPQAEAQPTFNLSVSGLNNFFVGLQGLLVHNDDSKLDRPGYSNYVLKDANGKVYYSGMFGPNETQAGVEARHAANNNRYSPETVDKITGKKIPGDKIEVLRETRTYGESRRLEHELSVKHGTYIGRDGDNYRGNRQYPMSDKKFKTYYPPGAC
jgi:hypothetical protein